MLKLITQPNTILDPLTPTIFHEDWWLKAATGGRYDVAEVHENGVLVGRLPYLLNKKLGVKTVVQPLLTHFLGPATNDGFGKPNTKFLRRLNITTELIRKLPDAASYYIKCHREIQDVLAFQEENFRAHVQFTHEIYPRDPALVWKDMRDKARNTIRAAKERHIVTECTDPQDFMRFYQENLDTKGKENYIDSKICIDLITACLERKRGCILQSKDPYGNRDAAIFCVWDQTSHYYLMTTHRPNTHVGATSVLVWNAIIDAMQKGLIFDFDGLISIGGARLANNFTATLSPRYIAIRESIPMKMIRVFQSMGNNVNYFC